MTTEIKVPPVKNFTVINTSNISWARHSFEHKTLEIKLLKEDKVLVLDDTDELYEAYLKEVTDLRNQVLEKFKGA